MQFFGPVPVCVCVWIEVTWAHVNNKRIEHRIEKLGNKRKLENGEARQKEEEVEKDIHALFWSLFRSGLFADDDAFHPNKIKAANLLKNKD